MESNKKKLTGLKLALNIVFYVILGLVVVYSVTALFSEQDLNKTSVFGISSLTVQSNSMYDTFSEGDLIFVTTKFDTDELEVGDVITYRMQVTVDDETYTIYNSHRIYAINEIGDTRWFVTKGDYNGTPDEDPVFQNDVLGVWTGTVWKGAGNTIDSIVSFLKSPTGFFIFIVIPCFGFLVYEVVKFVRVVSDYNVQKAVGDRDRLKAEALAAARAELEAERKIAEEEAAKKAE
jgi:signal peptidase